uniref:Uncharacterized protein n=1 Tax=Arundo donax TaxID=35708 RepID=A0A0A9CYZ6_ARUDO
MGKSWYAVNYWYQKYTISLHRSLLN